MTTPSRPQSVETPAHRGDRRPAPGVQVDGAGGAAAPLLAELLLHGRDALAVLDLDGRVQHWNDGAARIYGMPGEAVLGRPFEDLFEHADRLALQELLLGCARPAEAAGAGAVGTAPATLEVRACTPQGDALWVLLSVSPLPAGLLVHGMDITARRMAEDALRHALERANTHNLRLLELNRASLEINRLLGRPELVQRIADDARHLLSAHLCLVSICAAGEAGDRHAASLSAKYAAFRGQQDAVAQARQARRLCTLLLQHGAPVRLGTAELARHPRWRALAQPAPGRPALRGWLAVPLVGREGQPVGVLQLSDRHEGDFNDEDLAMATQLAQIAAAAVESDLLCSAALPPRMVAAPVTPLPPVAPVASVAPVCGALADSGLRAAAQQAIDERDRFFGLCPDLCGSADRHGRLQQLNPAFEELLGRDSASLVGTPWLELLHPDDRAAFTGLQPGERREHGMARLHPALLDRDPWLDWACSLAADGSVVFIGRRLAAAPRAAEAQAGAGRPAGAELAELAAQALREPLRKIEAFSERLQRRQADVLDEEGRQDLDRISQAGRRLSRLTGDLLAYAQAGSRAPAFESVDLYQLAMQVLAGLDAEVRRSDARVAVLPLPIVEADATQLRQLLHHLLVNALKFTRPGVPPQVQLSARSLAGEPARVEIEVRDHGIGIDPQQAARLFLPLQRLQERGRYEGSGLGLALVRTIAERHHGSVELRSVQGPGASFVLRLPLRQAAGTDDHGTGAVDALLPAEPLPARNAA
ncbi:ATP-binding protein [Eleftheria terrae]|uniref:ATP-binding protein n=1 Tax=Eleftheria terrae TaxID=1597781 RepID=UPI00263BC644|nr:ATP-binding protein [Eleftheria terrae]WKB54087.1 ATP-binding protein [Eleftheria terrae]